MNAQDDEEYAPSDAGEEGGENPAAEAEEEYVQDFSSATANIPDSAAAASTRKRTSSLDNPVTTARGSRKRAKKPRIRIGKRIRCRRSGLAHILVGPHADEQKAKLKNLPNNQFIYGTVTGGNSSDDWAVDFDIFPVGKRTVEKVGRKIIEILDAGQAEINNDHRTAKECEDATPAKKKDPATESTDIFCALSKDVLAIATSFQHRYGRGDDDFIEWQILADDEHVTDLPLDAPTEAALSFG